MSLPEVLGVVHNEGHLHGVAASTFLVVQGHFTMVLLVVGMHCNGKWGAIGRATKVQRKNTDLNRSLNRHFLDTKRF